MKAILVTGATDGIGLATAKQLYNMGHRILVHGRTKEKAEFAAGQVATSTLKKNLSDENLLPVYGDLSVMDEVVELANQVKDSVDTLDVLLNNAGVYMTERVLTQDGFEMTFAVNHLAPFLLTHKLLDKMLTQIHGRIINVASVAHQKGHLDFTNLQGEKHYDDYEAYATSKLCNILFTRALAAKLKNQKVTVNCLHPGVINTKLLRAGFSIQGESVDSGAKTSVYLATSADVVHKTGGYYVNCVETFPSRLAQDDKLAVQLWKKSEDLLHDWL